MLFVNWVATQAVQVWLILVEHALICLRERTLSGLVLYLCKLQVLCCKGVGGAGEEGVTVMLSEAP